MFLKVDTIRFQDPKDGRRNLIRSLKVKELFHKGDNYFIRH
jgi:hypothetical protein